MAGSDKPFRLVVSFLSLLPLSFAQTCYYAGGSAATDYKYTPCKTGSASACCIAGEGDACLSNGMCYYPGKNYFYRGACTDPTWSNRDNCPLYCLTRNPTGWLEITRCSNDTFCCQGDDSSSSCCDDLNKKFTTLDYWVINSYGQSVDVPGAVPSPSSTSSTLSATSSSSTTVGNPTQTSAPDSGTGGSRGGSGGLTTGQLAAAIVTPVCSLIATVAVAYFGRERIGNGFKNARAYMAGNQTGDAEAGNPLPPTDVKSSSVDDKGDGSAVTVKVRTTS